MRRRALKPWMIDAAIALAAWVASLVEIAAEPDRQGPLLANLAVASGYSLPLLLRRRAPLRVAVMMLSSAAVCSIFLTPINYLSVPLLDMILAGYAVGAFTRGRATVAGALILAVGMSATSPS